MYVGTRRGEAGGDGDLKYRGKQQGEMTTIFQIAHIYRVHGVQYIIYKQNVWK